MVRMICEIITGISKEVKNNIIRKLTRKKKLKLMMKYREMNIIDAVIEKIRPDNCLEWGSGYSTLYFPRLLSPASTWHSIEHDEIWANEVNKGNGRKNTFIDYIKPNNFPWSAKNGDGTYTDLKDYIEYPSDNAPYDFILIDGRARNECLKRAYTLLNKNGIVIMHDAVRPSIRKNAHLFNYSVLLTDHRENDGGLWIGSRDTPLNNILNIEYHKRIWNFYERIAPFFRIFNHVI